MRTCAVCFFFHGDFGAEQGDCWNEPPTAFLARDAEGEASFVSVRPTVGSQEFCGRFSHRNGPKASPAPEESA